MKVLITGSSGLVGSACMEFFSQKGWETIGIDNNFRSQSLGTPPKAVHTDLDFTNLGAVYDLFGKHTFDAIIHAGGQPSHDWSNDHVLEDFVTNALGTVILLEATRKFCPGAVFVYVSSDKVYGERMERAVTEGETRFHSKEPFDESLGLDFARRRSPFGCSKAAADMYVQEYAHTFGLRAGVFRPGCITGKKHEGAELHGFLAYMAKCVKRGLPYKVFGFSGKQVRDQIHANDLAKAFFEFIKSPRPGEVYNIGGGPERSISVLEALSVFEKKTGKRPLISMHIGRSGDRIWDVHDVSKFRSHYPSWSYDYSLEDIINDLV